MQLLNISTAAFVNSCCAYSSIALAAGCAAVGHQVYSGTGMTLRDGGRHLSDLLARPCCR
jgi:hypothetical protein